MDIVTKVKPEERGSIYEYRRDLVEEYLRIGFHRKVTRELEQEILADYGMIPRVLILPPVFLDSSMVLDNNKKSTNLYPQFLYHHVCGHPGWPAATSAVRLPVSDFA